MRIAIIGAGYAGMALAWYAQERGFSVTVFEAENGASVVSTGLLHHAPGKKAISSERAEEGIKATIELLQIASKKVPVFEQSGILRFAIDPQQEALFGGKTLWMPDGITVYSSLYLKELKKACLGVRFEKKKVQNLRELDHDQIIVAAGLGSLKFFDLPLKKTIGQSLLCRVKNRLEHSFLGTGHITPTEDPQICQVGSTYEHTEAPDPKEALKLIGKVAEMYPEAVNFEVLEVRSGVRVSPLTGYLPFMRKMGPKEWILTGFGSRGLLYHALLAKELIDQL
jgi:glycine/D-amino acid oxidase-like deaminating enzyme